MSGETLRATVYRLLEPDETGLDRASARVDLFLTVLILANVAAAVLETVPSINNAHYLWLEGFDRISVAIFTVEYAARLWTALEEPHLAAKGPLRGRLAAAGRPLMVIDLIAIAPAYLSLFVALDLRVLRLLRLLRFLKLARHSTALAAMGRVIAAEARALGAALLVMLAVLLTASTVMYELERHAQPDAFGSIPAAMWWGVATLTTVGYGDVAPVTVAGKMVGAVVMLLGLGMFAVPIGLLASGFDREIHRRDFVVNWSMVGRAPLFADLDGATVAEIAALLEARRVRAGAVIAAPGEPSDAMFFIQSGRVALSADGATMRLESGAFFGEEALLDAGPRAELAVAEEATKLLVLDAGDLRRLTARLPELKREIEHAAAARREARAAMQAQEIDV